jgi:transmembrane sensor
MEKEKLKELIQKYLRGEATAEEKEWITQWYHSFPADELTTHIPVSKETSEEALRLKMLQRLQTGLSLTGSTTKKATVRKLYTRWAVAAAVILVFIAGGLFFNKKEPKELAVKNVEPPKPVQHDIAPGGNRALLQLADGRTIVLDTAGAGILARQGATTINLAAGGQLSYQPPAGSTAPVLYNTLTTPKGGQYQLTLPDGTRVWLNAVSSIYFPTVFNGNERIVKITGEAYFEVAPDAQKPFKVQFGEAEVTVLGTHFNINAYTDETDARTTLLEGSILIRQGKLQRKLLPGQQAISNARQIQVEKAEDPEQSVAWKNGYFQFAGAGIETLMRQAARWYNISVVYRGAIPNDRFTGKIPRNVNLSEFLKILAYSDVHFKLEDRQVILFP